MDHKIILKCRVCLEECDEQEMFDLFKDDNGIIKLNQKIEYCCGIQIRESPEMPTKICYKCFDITRIWNNFRQVCVNSQVYLESMCTDRPDIKDSFKEEGDYLEYLLEDLQTFRAEARQTIAAFNSINTIQSENNTDSEGDNEYFEEIEMDAEESLDGNNDDDEDDDDAEQDFQNILCEIKKEPENDNNTEKTLTNKQQKKTPTTKKDGTLPKKYFRPPSPTSYMCSICGNVYVKKGAFKYHMTLHTNVKPHECELCGKAFRQVCELKNHMRRHTGEKPFKCSYCDRRFFDRSETHRHERIHTNTRPYVCKICGKSFMHSAILKNHLKLHSGEKDFNCHVCSKAFTLQHQLKAHLHTISHKQKETQLLSSGYEVVYE